MSEIYHIYPAKGRHSDHIWQKLNWMLSPPPFWMRQEGKMSEPAKQTPEDIEKLFESIDNNEYSSNCGFPTRRMHYARAVARLLDAERTVAEGLRKQINELKLRLDTFYSTPEAKEKIASLESDLRAARGAASILEEERDLARAEAESLRRENEEIRKCVVKDSAVETGWGKVVEQARELACLRGKLEECLGQRKECHKKLCEVNGIWTHGESKEYNLLDRVGMAVSKIKDLESKLADLQQKYNWLTSLEPGICKACAAMEPKLTRAEAVIEGIREKYLCKGKDCPAVVCQLIRAYDEGKG